MKFGDEKLETLRYHAVKTWSLYLTRAWFCTGTGLWRTDGRTDRIYHS